MMDLRMALAEDLLYRKERDIKKWRNVVREYEEKEKRRAERKKKWEERIVRDAQIRVRAEEDGRAQIKNPDQRK